MWKPKIKIKIRNWGYDLSFQGVLVGNYWMWAKANRSTSPYQL